MLTPYTLCPYSDDLHCSTGCPLCVVESATEFANRRECAEEGGGGEVIRQVDCLFEEWERWGEEVSTETENAEVA